MLHQSKLFVTLLLITTTVYIFSPILLTIKTAVDQKFNHHFKLKEVQVHLVERTEKTEKKTLPPAQKPKPKHAPTNETECARALPQAIIFGVCKSGTGALRFFLNQHPQIKVSLHPGVKFFNAYANYKKGLQWYRSMMQCSNPGDVTIDHTPQYFQSTTAPKRIKQYKKTTKLILIVREPVTRMVSQFLQMRETHKSKLKNLERFEPNVINLMTGRLVPNEMLTQSTYAPILRYWLKFFPIEQIYVVEGDSFSKHPLRELKKLETFLEVPKYFEEKHFFFNVTRGVYCAASGCLGNGKKRPHPKVHPQVVSTLKRYFYPYNERLYELIGKRFKW